MIINNHEAYMITILHESTTNAPSLWEPLDESVFTKHFGRSESVIGPSATLGAHVVTDKDLFSLLDVAQRKGLMVLVLGRFGAA